MPERVVSKPIRRVIAPCPSSRSGRDADFDAVKGIGILLTTRRPTHLVRRLCLCPNRGVHFNRLSAPERITDPCRDVPASLTPSNLGPRFEEQPPPLSQRQQQLDLILIPSSDRCKAHPRPVHVKYTKSVQVSHQRARRSKNVV